MKKILGIFQETNQLLILIDKANLFYRKQNHYKGLLLTGEISEKLNTLIPNLLEIRDFLNKDFLVLEDGFIIQMLNAIVEAQKNNDYVLIGDLYEGQLIPFLNTIQGVLRNENIDSPNGYWENNISALEGRDKELCKLIKKNRYTTNLGYSVEDTNVGAKTLKICRSVNQFYLHSNNNPFKEADIFAAEYIEKGIKEYTVYGFGFGYHIRSLLENNVNNVVTVYESDLYLLMLACEHCDMKDILNSTRLKIIYDPNFDKIRENFNKKDISLIIHYPSLMNIENKDIRERFEEYFLFSNSSKNQEDLLYRNFRRNLEKKSSYVDELKAELKNKKLIVVAGGPSLDNDMQYLRELSKAYKILAVGRVVKKLLNAGVIPDYIIMIDANEVLLDQIKGMDLETIPLLYLSTVYYEVLEEHKGKQYLILQEGYSLAEEYAKAHNFQLYSTGGSVSTTAIEVGIRLGCSAIICVGLDLAFVNNQTHASNTGGKFIEDAEDLRKVEGVDGGIVYTSKSLDSFRHWIERRIREEKNVRFINTSKGANIQGMENLMLTKIIKPIL